MQPPIVQFTSQQLSDYFSGRAKHKAYQTTVDIYNALKVHLQGTEPVKLIQDRRPSEPLDVQEYRKKIYEPITKSTVSKVITSLSKIPRSADWYIHYNVDNMPPGIREGERPEDYFEKNFPYTGSLSTWMFDMALRYYVQDPNGLIAIMPLEWNVPDNEYRRPFPFIFTSDRVYDYVPEKYAVLLSTDKVTFQNSNGVEGKVFYVFTTSTIGRWEQTTQSGDYRQAWEYAHGLDELPVFKTQGVFLEAQDTTFIYESRLSPMIPYLNEAAREYSDLQAGKVQNLHPTPWNYAFMDCGDCAGTGQLMVAGEQTQCQKCKGLGKVVHNSPYGGIVVKQPENGMASNIPMPPGGYIQKDVEIIKVLGESVDKHKYDALAAINMEFLAETPLNQSGTAKEIDRDELNTFVASIATDVVRMMKRIYYFCIEYRYKLAVPDKKTRMELAPRMGDPKRFDLINPNGLVDTIAKAKQAGVSMTLINAYQRQLAASQFTGDTEMGQALQCELALDPFPGYSVDDLMTMLANEGINKEDYVIKCNISVFVKRAIEEYEDKMLCFFEMDYQAQMNIIQGYAQELINKTENLSIEKPNPGMAANEAETPENEPEEEDLEEMATSIAEGAKPAVVPVK